MLPARLLCSALAGGSGPARPVFPTVTLNTSLLKVGPPSVGPIPGRAVADQNSFFPAYLSARLPASPLLAVSKLAQSRYLQPSDVKVHSVAVLLAVPDSQRGGEIRREVNTLRAITAGTLDPASLIPPRGQAALPFRALPDLFNPSKFGWAVCAASADGKVYLPLQTPYMPAGVLSEAQVNQAYTRQQQGSLQATTYDVCALKAERQPDTHERTPKVRVLDALVGSFRPH